jgi:hypothetical protein
MINARRSWTAEFPDLIPEIAVWNDLASEVRSGGFTSTGHESFSVEGREALLGAVALSGSDDILTRRDALARLLSGPDLEHITNWIDARRQQMSYTFPVPGKLGHPDARGSRRCTISVRGSEHPLLVPEAFYWDFYFRAKVDALGKYDVPTARQCLCLSARNKSIICQCQQKTWSYSSRSLGGSLISLSMRI